VLHSLSPRHFAAGYAEVAKYGLLGDPGFFAWLGQNRKPILAREPDALSFMVRRCCELKATIVQSDETEQGSRALLNLGHTFGHALEAAFGYSGQLLHGEAVAIGCGLAARLSARLGYCGEDVTLTVLQHFRGVGMKATIAELDGTPPSADRLMKLIQQDKKVVAGQARYVLLEGIGKAFVARDVRPDLVHRLLSEEIGSSGHR